MKYLKLRLKCTKKIKQHNNALKRLKYVEKFLEAARIHEAHWLRFVLLFEEGRTEGWLDIQTNSQAAERFKVHGGVTATLADIVAGFAAVYDCSYGLSCSDCRN